MYTKKFFGIILPMLFCFSLTACGSSAVSDNLGNDYGISMNKEFSEGADMYEDYSTDSYDSTNYSSEADIVKNNMMIAKTVSLSLDCENLDTFADNFRDTVIEKGGYFEESNIENYSSEYQTDRYANFTVRIPATELDDFISYMEGNTKLTSKNISAEDVSLQYVDVEAKIKSLETERDNLNKLYEECTNVSEILEIESQLSNIEYELDSYISQKRVLEGRVNYSIVHVNAHEERNIEHPIRKALQINITEKVIEGIEAAAETFVNIVVAIPVIIIVTGFAILFIWLLRKICVKIFKRKTPYIKYIRVPIEVTDEQNTEQEQPEIKNEKTNT